MSSETINFGKNMSARWTVPAIIITGDLVCPNGMRARLDWESPDAVRKTLSGLREGDVVVFVRDDMKALPGVISIDTVV